MLAVMPLLNNNNSFSNTALAQEYDKYWDRSYSQYPTDNKKYECRTGPFEGFFVSSVEFCKHVKFDKDNDRKDNSRDNQTGPAGANSTVPGPQGPPGINGTSGVNGTQSPITINTTNIYTKVGPINLAATNAGGPTISFTSLAFCDTGDNALSGSFRLNGSSVIRFDQPVITENGRNATAFVVPPAEGFTVGQVQADVVCFDNPPLRS